MIAQSNTATFSKSTAIPSGPPPSAPNSWEKILTFLRQRGEQGAYNYELVRIAIRYNARIREAVTEQSYIIKTVKESPSLWKYVLVSEPEHLRPRPTFQRKPRPVQPSLFSAGTGSNTQGSSDSSDWYERKYGPRPGLSGEALR